MGSPLCREETAKDRSGRLNCVRDDFRVKHTKGIELHGRVMAGVNTIPSPKQGTDRHCPQHAQGLDICS